MRTPYESSLKGKLNTITALQADSRLKPLVTAVSRRGFSLADPGLNKDWAADLIEERFPVASQFRRRLAAEGVEVRNGAAAFLRTIEVWKPAGLPTLVLDPISGWSVRGELAGPKGRLP
jgi:hypothetical protein